MKLEINKRRKIGKFTNTWKLNNPLLNDQKVKEDITKNVRKDFEMDESQIKTCQRGFPGGAVVENLPANAGDMGSSPGLGRSHMPRSN